MYSFQQCLFSKWDVRTTHTISEEEDKSYSWHYAKLPNPEHLSQHVGAGRPVNGRIQQCNAIIRWPQVEHGDRLDSDIKGMWLVEDLAQFGGKPTTELLVAVNIGMLAKLSSADLERLPDFPGRDGCELFCGLKVPEGVMYSAGSVKDGGLYLLFASEITEPIRLTVHLRHEVNVNNL